MKRQPPRSTRTDTPFPSTTLFRSLITSDVAATAGCFPGLGGLYGTLPAELGAIQDDLGIRRVRSRYSAIMDSKEWGITNVLSFEPSDGITLKYIFGLRRRDRKSTRLNSSH